MSEKHNELVEEIASRIAAHSRGILREHNGNLDKDFAELLITLILSAVRDGLEIPGEEARIKDCYISELVGCRDIIVFGKEGEK